MRLMTGLLLIFVGLPNYLFGASFTVPLFPIVAHGQHGDYLSADFDFDVKFSDVESVTLEFVIADGYDGTAMST
jgi:hypothetical protein